MYKRQEEYGPQSTVYAVETKSQRHADVNVDVRGPDAHAEGPKMAAMHEQPSQGEPHGALSAQETPAVHHAGAPQHINKPPSAKGKNAVSDADADADAETDADGEADGKADGKAHRDKDMHARSMPSITYPESDMPPTNETPALRSQADKEVTLVDKLPLALVTAIRAPIFSLDRTTTSVSPWSLLELSLIHI